MSSLKTFIRAVRSAKTQNDERSVIQKESAAIRASFRESNSHNTRRNNIAKLLYLFTLGERTHFGQMECVKLLASPRFADKRLGYLGTMLLLDEKQEVLTLVTNSLKNDLNHSNQYIVGLALCTLGNIASTEMARDLFMEVEQLLSTANPYIRRKAALCAMRIIRKVPELQDHFIEKTKLLLQDRNHGVLLCGITLVTDLCLHDPELVEQFRPFTPVLVKQLKALASSGYSPEHDVTGITDPFLQVKILKLMRVLGKGDEVISEQINDILAQVATNTDSTKNVGNSILYEAVLTILDIEADSSLRVLGINILGKFLSNKDNNIRYVALNTLVKVVALEPNAIQRHRNTILDCLRDPDISIRRRALELSFTLINADNVRLLIRELLAFLEIANNEFKPMMTTEISIAADRYAPSKRWQIDTMLRVLTLAGNYVKEPILSSFIRLVATTNEQQSYTVRKLYRYLKADITQESLTVAGAWVIGEFGEYLLRGGDEKDSGLVGNVADSEIIDLFNAILSSSYATASVKEYVLTALVKLTTRISTPSQIERVRRLLDSYSADVDVEIQQRAVEYGNLFGSGNDIRQGVLEKMPPPEIREENRVLGEAVVKKSVRKAKPSAPASKDILNLLGDEPVASPSATPSVSNTDILLDLFGSGPAPSAPAPSSSADMLSGLGSTSSPAPSSSNDIMSLFGSTSTPVAAAPAQPSAPPADALSVYNKNGLNIFFQIQRAPDVATVISHFQNTGSGGEVSALHLEFAVLKSQRLEFAAPLSAASLQPGSEATQVMRILGIGNAPVRVRLRLSYATPGTGTVQEQMNWSEPKN